MSVEEICPGSPDIIRLNMMRPTAHAPTRPTVSPITDCQMPRPATSHKTERPLAPRAIRMPISRLRWLTEYAVTP